jgi:hypothetical protein
MPTFKDVWLNFILKKVKINKKLNPLVKNEAGQKNYPKAGNGIRTRDIKLGKLALYQLSYARNRLKL